MALDARNKRASAIGFGLPMLVVLPVPGGVIVAAARAQLAASYPFGAAAIATNYDRFLFNPSPFYTSLSTSLTREVHP